MDRALLWPLPVVSKRNIRPRHPIKSVHDICCDQRTCERPERRKRPQKVVDGVDALCRERNAQLHANRESVQFFACNAHVWLWQRRVLHVHRIRVDWVPLYFSFTQWRGWRRRKPQYKSKAMTENKPHVYDQAYNQPQLDTSKHKEWRRLSQVSYEGWLGPDHRFTYVFLDSLS